MKILAFPFRVLWTFFVILTPLLGVWVASSLAVYLNGPVWLACVAGALLFPALPLVWELRGRGKRAKRAEEDRKRGVEPRTQILSFWDRMVLRTLAVNLAFLGLLLWVFPVDTFTSLSTRGDWMLQGKEGAEIETIRGVLFASAGSLEWLYEVSRERPYIEFDDGSSDKIIPEPSPEPSTRGRVVENRQRKAGGPPSWPMPNTLHPLVVNMPSSAEASIESVARYIMERESDPVLRVKALHDYVADRISYDAPALAAGLYPPQDAETVFRTRKAVCAGYAKLIVAMGKVTGDEIVYVVGVSRGLGGEVSGGGHAWNSVKIHGSWYLMDATWDSGYVNNQVFTKRYTSNYFLTPPSVFGASHFPENPNWQLRETVLTRGEFMRLPMLRPSFYRAGLELISPTRSQVSVDTATIQVKLNNQQGQFLSANLMPKAASGKVTGKPCRIQGRETVTISCDAPSDGTYQVWLFSGDERFGTRSFVGQVEVNASL